MPKRVEKILVNRKFNPVLIIKYKKSQHSAIIHACILALKQGKILVYPTDTSYGLAVDATNVKAIKKLYKLKGRNFNKPIHVIPPSVGYVKKILRWNKRAEKLAKAFWPRLRQGSGGQAGPLTLVLGMKPKVFRRKNFKMLSANGGWLGVRMPNNKIALDLAKHLGKPITTTSANVSGKKDCYSAQEIIDQFSAKGGSGPGGKNKKIKPDIIINVGKLPKKKPSTIVRVDEAFFIFRKGPISEKQILAVIPSTKRESINLNNRFRIFA